MAKHVILFDSVKPQKPETSRHLAFMNKKWNYIKNR